MTMFRTWARHISAAIISLFGTWLVTILTGLGLTAQEAGEFVSNLESLITMGILVGLYAIFEKGLKPLWYNTFGERQREEV